MHRNGFISTRDLAILAGIVLFAIVVRTAFLGHEPLYIDEGYSFWFSSQDWGYLWTKVPEFETHPPFYYSALKLWREAFGSDEASLRLLSVLLSVLIVPLVYLSARLLDRSESGRTLALLAALLMAGWPYQIRYAQEARPYAFLALATAFTLLCLVWIIQNPKRLRVFPLSAARQDPLAILCILGLGAGLALHMWLHNLGIIIAGLVGLYLIFWWAVFLRFDRAVFISLLLAGVFALLLYSPNIPNLLAQVTMVSDNFWVKVPSRTVLAESFIELYGVPLFWEMRQYDILRLNFGLGVAGLLLGLIGFLRISNRQREKEVGKANFLLMMLLIFGPVIISLIVTYFHRPIFLTRTLISVQIPLVIILASAPWALPAYFRTAFIVIISVLALTVGPALQWEKMTGKVSEDRTYPLMIDYILQDKYSEAPVLVMPNSIALSVDYYKKQKDADINSYPLPGPYPVTGEDADYPAGLGVPTITHAAVQNVLPQLESAPVVWVISRKNDLFDPDGIVQDALEKDWPCRKLISGNGTTHLSLTRYSTNEECLTRE